MSAIETSTTPLTIDRLRQIGNALTVSVIELLKENAAPQASRVEDVGRSPIASPERIATEYAQFALDMMRSDS